MSEFVKAAQEHAHQELTATDKVRRWAMCPIHQHRTSTYLGPTAQGWAFRCLSAGGHFFYAKPDPSAPKTAEDTQEWIRRQKAARLEKLNG